MRLGEILLESHGITGAKFADFVRFCVVKLGIEHMPKIHLVDELPDNNSFGVYYPDRKESHIAVDGRHPVDVMRTVAHELVHARQRELKDELDGSTGSDDENEANAQAGVLMREFAPQLFGKRDEVTEMGVGGVAMVAQPMVGAPNPNYRKKKRKKKNKTNEAQGEYTISRPDYYDGSGSELYGRIVAAENNEWPDDYSLVRGVVEFSNLADEIVLSNIVVRPQYRSQGLGEELVDALLAHAQELGLPVRTTAMTDDGARLFGKYEFDDSGAIKGKL